MMQEVHGSYKFPFWPKTFVLPKEYKICRSEMLKDSRVFWISKPAGSSQGKGIYITNKINDINIRGEESIVVSHYISNPLTIDGLKFDLRIYVAITNLNPLRIYIYEEGLVRFATEIYEAPKQLNRDDSVKLKSQFIHLTNYSINKLNKKNFVHNKDDGQSTGSKWSIAGLRSALKQRGIDDDKIFRKIKDLAVKTIIAAEPTLNQA